jgi:hypothetical protein
MDDEYTEINLYALGTGKQSELAAPLSNESHTPSINEVFNCCCMFIDFVYSLESEYLHAISIRAKEYISPIIYPILADLDNRIGRFEEEIQRVEAVDEYIVTLEQLACGPCGAS